MKLSLKFPKVKEPRLVNKFLQYRILFDPVTTGKRYSLGMVRGQRVLFPDLPDLKFYIAPNGLGGNTITELRTGLALHKCANPSVELCLVEATAKLEHGFRRFGGPKGFLKHVRSLPSKEESMKTQKPVWSPPPPVAEPPRRKEAPRKKSKGMSLSKR